MTIQVSGATSLSQVPQAAELEPSNSSALTPGPRGGGEESWEGVPELPHRRTGCQEPEAEERRDAPGKK